MSTYNQPNLSQAQKAKDKVMFKQENFICEDLALKIHDLLNINPSEFEREYSNTILDELSNGFGKKSLNIFTGPSGSGKSGILLNLAYNFAESHDKVCYVSFENDLATDAERLQEMRKTYGKEIEFDYFNYLDLGFR